jgi:hypothetical protein
VSRCYGPRTGKTGRSKSAIRDNVPWKAGRPMDCLKIRRAHEAGLKAAGFLPIPVHGEEGDRDL